MAILIGKKLFALLEAGIREDRKGHSVGLQHF
jgi:hypothetical protein